MNDASVRRGFYAAAAYNIVGMFVFSKALNSQTLFDTDPAVFSRQGCVLIMVWGLAYLAQASSWRKARAVTAVFALEKFLFAGWWAFWLAHHHGELSAIAAKDALAGAFYAVYGLGDAAFMVFFAWATRKS